MLQYIRRLADWLKGTKFSKTKVGRFIVDVLIELLGVTWPSWNDIKSSTIVVLVTLVLVAIYLGLVGALLLWGVQSLQYYVHSA